MRRAATLRGGSTVWSFYYLWPLVMIIFFGPLLAASLANFATSPGDVGALVQMGVTGLATGYASCFVVDLLRRRLRRGVIVLSPVASIPSKLDIRFVLSLGERTFRRRWRGRRSTRRAGNHSRSWLLVPPHLETVEAGGARVRPEYGRSRQVAVGRSCFAVLGAALLPRAPGGPWRTRRYSGRAAAA